MDTFEFREMQIGPSDTCSKHPETELSKLPVSGDVDKGSRACPQCAQGVALTAEQSGVAVQTLLEKKIEERYEIGRRELEEAGICPVCRGDTAQHPCFECSDTGRYYSAQQLLEENLCNDCKGSGRWHDRACFSCKGSGKPTKAMVKLYMAEVERDIRNARSG